MIAFLMGIFFLGLALSIIGMSFDDFGWDLLIEIGKVLMGGSIATFLIIMSGALFFMAFGII